MTDQVTETNPQTQGLALGLNDLALMANIIQVTSERGAIKANEMQAVGGLYEKLVAFVNANMPQPEDKDNETEAPDSTEE